jgi:hypothetical protein
MLTSGPHLLQDTTEAERMRRIEEDFVMMELQALVRGHSAAPAAAAAAATTATTGGDLARRMA